MINSKDFEEFSKIHDEEMEKAQEAVKCASSKMGILFGELAATQFFEEPKDGYLKIDFKENGPSIDISCTRPQLIFTCFKLLDFASNGDMAKSLSLLLGFMVTFETQKRRNHIITKDIVIDKEKSSQEEIDVFKAMMSMSPEELEKLKKQMNE